MKTVTLQEIGRLQVAAVQSAQAISEAIAANNAANAAVAAAIAQYKKEQSAD